MINWDNFCTYIIMRFQEQDLSNSTRDIPFIAKPRLIRFPNIKVKNIFLFIAVPYFYHVWCCFTQHCRAGEQVEKYYYQSAHYSQLV